MAVLSTLIGDVVGSRHVAYRARLQHRLQEVLHGVDALVPPAQSFEVTVGDEFQGAYRDLPDALRASLLVRLALLPDADTRYGVGRGEVTVFDASRTPRSQDGPGWWAAREAIGEVHDRQERRGSSRTARTRFIDRLAVADDDRATAALVNAFLLSRDEMVGAMADRPRRLLLGALQGRTQAELAAQEGISQSAVSQSLARSGAYAVRDGHDLLDERTQ